MCEALYKRIKQVNGSYHMDESQCRNFGTDDQKNLRVLGFSSELETNHDLLVSCRHHTAFHRPCILLYRHGQAFVP